MAAWNSEPMIFLPRLRCPRCGSLRTPLRIRSANGGDGSVSRKYICRDCGGRFLAVFDPQLPVLGMTENPLPTME